MDNPPGAPAHPRVNVLLVDDEPANLRALEAVLAPLEQRLVLASSGHEALRHLQDEEYAVILLDLRMPGLDGFETAELIRARPATRTTPLVFLAALQEAEHDLQRAYRLGAADVIFKPFAPEALRTKAGVFVDIGLQQRAIRELLTQAEASARAKTEFLNMAAHELRTPLAVVTGYLSMLSDGTFGEMRPDWQRVLKIMMQKGQDLNAVVNELVSAGPSRAVKGRERVTRCDLREVARQAVAKATPQAELLAADLSLRLPPEPAFVEADPTPLARAVDDMVNTALTSARGRPRILVAVHMDEGPLLTVEDSVAGVRSELRPSAADRPPAGQSAVGG